MQTNSKVHVYGVFARGFIVLLLLSFHYLLVLFLWCVRAPSNLIPRLYAFHLINFVCLWADTIYKYLSLVSRRRGSVVPWYCKFWFKLLNVSPPRQPFMPLKGFFIFLSRLYWLSLYSNRHSQDLVFVHWVSISI